VSLSHRIGAGPVILGAPTQPVRGSTDSKNELELQGALKADSVSAYSCF